MSARPDTLAALVAELRWLDPEGLARALSRHGARAYATWESYCEDAPQHAAELQAELARRLAEAQAPRCQECAGGLVVSDTCDECGERHCSSCEPCESPAIGRLP